MRVNYDVGNDASWGEGHIFLRHNHSYNAFLSVTRSKFVAQFRDTLITNSDFHQLTSFTCLCDKDVVHNAGLRLSHINRSVSHRWAFDFKLFVFFEESRWTRSSDENVAASYLGF